MTKLLDTIITEQERLKESCWNNLNSKRDTGINIHVRLWGTMRLSCGKTGLNLGVRTLVNEMKTRRWESSNAEIDRLQ